MEQKRNMREQFVARNLQLISMWRGHIPGEVRNVMEVLKNTDPTYLTPEQFNTLQDFGGHVDTHIRLARLRGRKAADAKAKGPVHWGPFGKKYSN